MLAIDEREPWGIQPGVRTVATVVLRLTPPATHTDKPKPINREPLAHRAALQVAGCTRAGASGQFVIEVGLALALRLVVGSGCVAGKGPLLVYFAVLWCRFSFQNVFSVCSVVQKGLRRGDAWPEAVIRRFADADVRLFPGVISPVRRPVICGSWIA
jgi:hypothetical protein